MSTKVPHPIPYQGSKRSLAPTILAFFPPDVHTLYEPFAGSAAVSLAAAHHRLAQQFILSDRNGPLMELWQAIITEPERIAQQYEVLWNAQLGNEREFYDYVRACFNQTKDPHYFLYLLVRCVKASVRYNANGEFNQSPDNRRRGTKPTTMRAHILAASKTLAQKTQCYTASYTEILEQVKPADLIYMDPPYQGVVGKRDSRYIEGVQFEEFIDVLSSLNQRDISYIVSYDGRTGSKSFGKMLPKSLNLQHREVAAGRSSQATLLGRDDKTYESLYLSPALVSRNHQKAQFSLNQRSTQQKMEIGVEF